MLAQFFRKCLVLAAWMALVAPASTALVSLAKADTISVVFDPPGSGQSYWWHFFGHGSLADDDVIVTQNNLPDHETIYLQQDRQVGTFTLSSTKSLFFENDNIAPGAGLLINGGRLAVSGYGDLAFQLPLVFATDANLHLQGRLSIHDPLVALGDITVQGTYRTGAQGPGFSSYFEGLRLVEGSSLNARGLNIHSSAVAIRTSGVQIGPIVLGDGVGARQLVSQFPAHSEIFDSALLSTTQASSSFDVTIRRDGTWTIPHGGSATQLRLDGGAIEAGGALRAPGKVTANAVQISGGPLPVVQDALITGRGGVNLNGNQVEFAVTGVDSLTGLLLESKLMNGSLLKTGAGMLTMAGEQSSTHTATLVREGTLRLAVTGGATGVPGSLTIGDNSTAASLARLHNGAHHQIPDATPVTLRNGARWLLNGFNETISGLTLAGSEAFTGDGTLTLGGNVESQGVQGLPTPQISGKINLGGGARTFTASHTSGTGIDLILSGIVSNGSLVKDGNGTMRLSGGIGTSSTMSSVTLAAGTLELAKANGVNAIAGDLIVGSLGGTPSGPTLKWLASNQVEDSLIMKLRSGVADLNGFQETISGIRMSGGGTASVATGAGKLVLTGGSVGFLDSKVLINGNIELGSAFRTFEMRGGTGQSDFANFSLQGTINHGGIAKTGAGTLELNSAGNYLLRIDQGIVRAGNATMGGLLGSGTLDIVTSAEVNTVAGQTSTFSGLITGGGALVIGGAGVQELDGFNSYTGGTTIRGGTAELLSGASLGTGLVTLDGGTIRGNRVLNAIRSRNEMKLGPGGGTLDTNGTDKRIIWEHPISSANGINDGGLTLTGGGAVELSQPNTYRGRTTVVDGTSLVALNTSGSATGTGNVAINGGTLTGNGRIAPNLGNDVILNDGVIRPGDSAGTLNFGFSSIFLASSHLFLNGGSVEFELGTAFDLIHFTSEGDWLRGTGATLEIIPIDGFDPNATYTLFSNVQNAGSNFSFADIIGGVPGYNANVFYHAGSSSYRVQFAAAPSLAGDFNGDGSVDAADYVLWRRNGGTQTEYESWRANFGTNTSGTASLDAAVPEPEALWSLVLAFVSGISGCSYRRCRGLSARWY